MSSSNFPKYSVLMSVYMADDPDELQQSIDSILKQSVEADDFVIVCDGPLSRELEEVLDQAKELSTCIRIYRLSENRGLGEALAYGVLQCKNEFIARMDADDISLPDRCKKQLMEFKKTKADAIGGFIVEFYDDPRNPKNIRRVPEQMEDIVKFAKLRSPINHVSVMYRKSSVLAAGSYKDLPLLEDYYLWIRMIAGGAIFYNIQQPLVLVRTGEEMYARRSGLKLCKSQIKLAKYMKLTNFFSNSDFIKNIFLRVGGTLLPNVIRRSIYERKLRDKICSSEYR